MNLYPPLTNLRSHLSYQFSSLRMRALGGLLWRRLRGKRAQLAVFPEEAPQTNPNRRFAGLQDIPIEAIIGTVNRLSDFDHKFRPLKKHLRDRWVNAFLTLQTEGWSPLLVHKVGEHYYVEDGHHRVSVAQALGIVFVEAKVWEYLPKEAKAKKCDPNPCEQRRSIQEYARATNEPLSS